MNIITYPLSSPVIYALGWTLFHALWQGFALVLSTALVLHVLRGQSSAVRYRAGVLALLAQPLLSAGTFVWYYKPLVSAVVTPGATTTLPIRSLATQWQAMTHTLPWHRQIQVFLDDHLSQFVVIYLIGVALFGIRLMGGWLYLQHLNRTAAQPVSDRLVDLARQLQSILQIRSVVRIRESAQIVVPMVVNSLKPVLLLPIGLATHLSVPELEAVLAHELAHVKRHDYAVNLLQSVMEVLYFFHPAIWWLSARVREEREHCCDDLAIQACGNNGRILAQALARVEELRLAQSSQTPALAMALTTKRQLLLQRVRRVLGVPTRPVVSNGSLIGLTLATLLLVSASVYAIQQQPKPAKPKPQSFRRLSAGNGTEFSVTENNKIDYVIWKGQKLPAKRVARLQRQLDQVMSGQLSLDTVPQPDRDILLAIIETNHSLDQDMNTLDDGLTHIDYTNIVASSLNNVPLIPDDAKEEIANIDYNGLINDAFASLSEHQPLSDTLDRLRKLHQTRIDSLSQLMAQQSKQMEALQRQMEKLRFPVEEIERGQETLEWRKQRLLEERQRILEKRQQLLNSAAAGKNKVDPATIEKQLELLEPEIKKQELRVDELNKQLEDAQKKAETARQPMEQLEQEVEKMSKQLDLLSEEMSRHSEKVARIIVENEMDLDIPIRIDAKPAKRALRPSKSLRGIARPYPATAVAPVAPPALVSPPDAPDALVPVLPAAPSPAKITPAPKRKK